MGNIQRKHEVQSIQGQQLIEKQILECNSNKQNTYRLRKSQSQIKAPGYNQKSDHICYSCNKIEQKNSDTDETPFQELFIVKKKIDFGQKYSFNVEEFEKIKFTQNVQTIDLNNTKIPQNTNQYTLENIENIPLNMIQTPKKNSSEIIQQLKSKSQKKFDKVLCDIKKMKSRNELFKQVEDKNQLNQSSREFQVIQEVKKKLSQTINVKKKLEDRVFNNKYDFIESQDIGPLIQKIQKSLDQQNNEIDNILKLQENVQNNELVNTNQIEIVKQNRSLDECVKLLNQLIADKNQVQQNLQVISKKEISIQTDEQYIQQYQNLQKIEVQETQVKDLMTQLKQKQKTLNNNLNVPENNSFIFCNKDLRFNYNQSKFENPNENHDPVQKSLMNKIEDDDENINYTYSLESRQLNYEKIINSDIVTPSKSQVEQQDSLQNKVKELRKTHQKSFQKTISARMTKNQGILQDISNSLQKSQEICGLQLQKNVQQVSQDQLSKKLLFSKDSYELLSNILKKNENTEFDIDQINFVSQINFDQSIDKLPIDKSVTVLENENAINQIHSTQQKTISQIDNKNQSKEQYIENNQNEIQDFNKQQSEKKSPESMKYQSKNSNQAQNKILNESQQFNKAYEEQINIFEKNMLINLQKKNFIKSYDNSQQIQEKTLSINYEIEDILFKSLENKQNKSKISWGTQSAIPNSSEYKIDIKEDKKIEYLLEKDEDNKVQGNISSGHSNSYKETASSQSYQIEKQMIKLRVHDQLNTIMHQIFNFNNNSNKYF